MSQLYCNRARLDSPAVIVTLIDPCHAMPATADHRGSQGSSEHQHDRTFAGCCSCWCRRHGGVVLLVSVPAVWAAQAD